MQADPKLLNSTAKAKGRRPYFFDDPAVDKLLAMTMALAGELAVTRERLDTVERILAEKGLHLGRRDRCLASRRNSQAGACRRFARNSFPES